MHKIFCYDEYGPETMAMLQALYSRSPASVVDHVEKVKKTGSDKFMQNYYVGYGHASIGDCGTTTLFFEQVSILAAKVLQDHPLYSGQETSTRYINFSTQPVYDPVGTPESQIILRNWVNFYNRSLPQVIDYVRLMNPSDHPDAKYEKAVRARAFDIMRGFLPAGMTTQLSLSINLRQAYDRFTYLLQHPLKEIKDIATTALKVLSAKYPSSFTHQENKARDDFYWANSKYLFYARNRKLTEEFQVTKNIDVLATVAEIGRMLASRPKGALLPSYMYKYGQYTCQFLLDYGSFRDLQRHRNGVCRLPVLDNTNGFSMWYMKQLPPNLQCEAVRLVLLQKARIQRLMTSEFLDVEKAQYFLPLGTNVACELVYGIPEMIYVAELRSSIMVHPTLRPVAFKLGNALRQDFPDIALYQDESVHDFDVRRGEQDIVEK